MLGALLLLSLAAPFLDTGGAVASPTTDQLRFALYVQSILQILLMAVIPLAWGYGTRLVPFEGMVRYFRLQDPRRGALRGILWFFAVLAALMVLGYLLELFGVPQDNPVKDQLTSVMTVPLALAVAVAAGVGEEVLFRGLLLRGLEGVGARMGLARVPTQAFAVGVSSVLFGLAHASYGTPLQVLVPIGLGVLFGVLVVRGGSLWTVIVAHFLYDVVALLPSLLPESAP